VTDVNFQWNLVQHYCQQEKEKTLADLLSMLDFKACYPSGKKF